MPLVTAQTQIDLLLARIRDPNATSTPRDVVREVLSVVQQTVNAGLGRVLAEASLTLSFATDPDPPMLIDVDSAVPDAVRIIQVRDGERIIPEVGWRELGRLDRRWYRRVGPRITCWARLGCQRVVFWPCPPIGSSGPTLTIRYVTTTATLISEAQTLELFDYRLPLVTDLTEAILLTRRRLVDRVEGVARRIPTDVVIAAQG